MDVGLVRRLVGAQFPQWAHLPVAPVRVQGHDNRTFRLGGDLAVRLPSHERYAAAIAKEDRFLPLLAARLTVEVPVPVATGRPSPDFPRPWSVRRWIEGETADRAPLVDRRRLAADVGSFLRELRAVPAGDGPPGGPHSFLRGCHPGVYGDQVAAALAALPDRRTAALGAAIWREAVETSWPGPPVWVHGDLAPGNLLVRDGRLAAVIDFGTCAVGDPACDLVLAWTFLDPGEREALAEAAGLPDDAWARARGWALWKALVTLREAKGPQHDVQARALDHLLRERGQGLA